MLQTTEQYSYLNGKGATADDGKLHAVPIDLFGEDEVTMPSREFKSSSFDAKAKPRGDITIQDTRIAYRKQSIRRLQAYLRLKRQPTIVELPSRKRQKEEPQLNQEILEKRRKQELARRFMELSGRRMHNSEIARKNFSNNKERQRAIKQGERQNKMMTPEEVKRMKVKSAKKSIA